MADLDDFFAKKDRKKKSVKKFATADELAKKMDDTKQKTDVRPKKERPATEGDESRRAGEEEEWKDYEETVKDYTGLKIQVLQGGAAPDAGRDLGGDDATGVDGAGRIKGPWNKPQAAAAAVVEEEKPAPPPPAAPEPEKKAYVAPSPAAKMAARQDMPRRNQSKTAPDIHNDDFFPSLGAIGRAGAGRGGGGWATAGAGGGGGAQLRRRDPRQPLAIGNRFTHLPDDS